jgi:hypothetical protein
MFCTKCGRKSGAGDKFCKYCGKPIGRGNAKESVPFSTSELYIKRILGVILLVGALPLFALSLLASGGISIISGLTIAIIFAIYLLRSGRYHFVSEILFALVALATYAVPAAGLFLAFNFPPIAPLTTLKASWITADWTHSGVGTDYSLFLVYLGASAESILFASGAFFTFLTDIFSKIKRIVNSPKRNRINGLAFLAIFMIVFILPWLHKVEVANSTGASGSPPGSGVVLDGQGSGLHNTVAFNADKDVWIYKIQLSNTTSEEGVIIALKAKTLGGKTVTLAPPFGDNIEVTGGVKAANKIGVMPGQKLVTIQLSSQEPLILIVWVEQNGKVGGQIGFWK